MNPLDWTAGPFLTLYVCLTAAVIWLTYIVRSQIGADEPPSTFLTPAELAYLVDGPQRVGDVLLAGLVASKAAEISADGRTVEVKSGAELPADVKQFGPAEISGEMNRQKFQKKIKSIADGIRAKLERLRLMPDSSQAFGYRLKTLMLFAVPMVLGIAKVSVGMERHKPVGILLFLLFATFMTGIFMLAARLHTRAGKETLKAYRADHARAARAPVESEIPLAVALAGLMVLSGTEYHALYAASRNWNGGGVGDAGGGGGDGGGGGCGGCGG
jgi:uncharacterized protein (TIGR04222 family)